MDSLIAAAARALAKGDPLGALNRVALREDPPALALRGIAMAQLGEFARARALLKQAARGFGARETLARARCVLAEAEIAIAQRDVKTAPAKLEAAAQTLRAQGDSLNASYAEHLLARRLLLIGRLGEAERALRAVDPSALPPPLRAAHHLIAGSVAMRRMRSQEARRQFEQAVAAAHGSGVAALIAETESARAALEASVMRLTVDAVARDASLAEAEQVLASDMLVIDACRFVVLRGNVSVSLARRPVLFALARALGEAAPEDAPREALIARAFRGRQADESHRARLRVEIGRLRTALAGLATITATERGFALAPAGAEQIAVLAPANEDGEGAILAILSDGEAWSSSALALALGRSQRTVQRALEALARRGKARAVGEGRARRWAAADPIAITTPLLLPGSPPGA